MKRIAFIIQDLCGEGAEYATALLVRGFCEKGYDVDLLLSQVHRFRIEVNGEKPFNIPEMVNVIMLPKAKARNNIWAIRRYLRNGGAGAVVTMSGNYEMATAIASLGLKKPHLYTVEHGIRFALNRKCEYASTPHFWNMERIRRRLIYACFDGILAVSRGVKRELHRMFGVAEKKVHVVYNPVIDNQFSEKIGETTRHPWLIEKKCPTLVSAGTLSQAKDYMTLIKAVENVARRRKVRLVIFGEGAYRPQYERYIKDHGLEEVISLPGFTDQLSAEEKVADGFISSSLLESFGIAIVEALACKIPVIATDAPCGAREILDNGRFGALVRPHDIQDMELAIDKLLDGKIEVAGDIAWKRFDRSSIVDLYETALGFI